MRESAVFQRISEGKVCQIARARIQRLILPQYLLSAAVTSLSQASFSFISIYTRLCAKRQLIWQSHCAVLIFLSLNKILRCHHSNEISSACLSHCTSCFLVFYKKETKHYSLKFWCVGGQEVPSRINHLAFFFLIFYSRNFLITFTVVLTFSSGISRTS